MKRIVLEKDDQKIRYSRAITANDDEGENRTGSTSQTGFMELIKLIATNLRYEEGKYGRSEDGVPEEVGMKLYIKGECYDN